jgi:hypothetical protein
VTFSQVRWTTNDGTAEKDFSPSGVPPEQRVKSNLTERYPLVGVVPCVAMVSEDKFPHLTTLTRG